MKAMQRGGMYQILTQHALYYRARFDGSSGRNVVLAYLSRNRHGVFDWHFDTIPILELRSWRKYKD